MVRSHLKPFIHQIHEISASFEIILTSRLSGRPIENLNIEMDLGQGAGGIKCMASRGSGGLARGGIGGMDVGISGTSGASWNFDTKKKVKRYLCSPFVN